MTDFIVFLWIALLITLVTMTIMRIRHPKTIVSFNDYYALGGSADVPYVTLDIQGKPYNLLVDTGSGICVIARHALKGLKFAPCKKKVSIEALTPESLPTEVIIIPIDINNKKIEEKFVVHEAEDLANFQRNYGVVLHGLIGTPFLDKTNCSIDFKTHTITFN